MTPQADHPLQELVLPARPDAAATARQVVVDACPPELGPEATAHAELVTSELVANAVEHGTGSELTLSVRPLDDAAVEIRVRNRCAHDLPPRPWRMPGPGARRGRGLAVVAAVTREVEAERTDNQVEIRAVVAAV